MKEKLDKKLLVVFVISIFCLFVISAEMPTIVIRTHDYSELAGQNINISGYNITADVGIFNSFESMGILIINTPVFSQDVVPKLHNVYYIGNSSNWWKELYAKKIIAENITSDILHSENITSDYLNATEIEGENITVSNDDYEIYGKDGDLIIKLK